jgi:hypothetical protein
MYIDYCNKTDIYYTTYNPYGIKNINNTYDTSNTIGILHKNIRIIIRLNSNAILSDNYNMYNQKVIVKLKLYNNNHFIDSASSNGQVSVL